MPLLLMVSGFTPLLASPFLNSMLSIWLAVVADEAFPDNVAVIVPAEKLPEASRATIAEAVFALVALDVTVKVCADEPLNIAEPDKPVPDVARVKLLET